MTAASREDSTNGDGARGPRRGLAGSPSSAAAAGSGGHSESRVSSTERVAVSGRRWCILLRRWFSLSAAVWGWDCCCLSDGSLIDGDELEEADRSSVSFGVGEIGVAGLDEGDAVAAGESSLGLASDPIADWERSNSAEAILRTVAMVDGLFRGHDILCSRRPITPSHLARDWVAENHYFFLLASPPPLRP